MFFSFRWLYPRLSFTEHRGVSDTQCAVPLLHLMNIYVDPSCHLFVVSSLTPVINVEETHKTRQLGMFAMSSCVTGVISGGNSVWGMHPQSLPKLLNALGGVTKTSLASLPSPIDVRDVPTSKLKKASPMLFFLPFYCTCH